MIPHFNRLILLTGILLGTFAAGSAIAASSRGMSSTCFNSSCLVCVGSECKTVRTEGGASISNKNGSYTLNGVPWEQIQSGDVLPAPRRSTPRAERRQNENRERSSRRHAEFCNGEPGQIHANGGGFVADSAEVGNAVYVGPNAMVCGDAEVSGAVRIEGRSIVRGQAEISGAGVISDSIVSGQVEISGAPRILNSRLKGQVEINGAPLIADVELREGAYGGNDQVTPEPQGRD